MERHKFVSPGILGADQRGTTGLATAIVLIFFVSVASVPGFAVQVKSNKGPVVIVNRTTPPELKAIMELN